MYRRIWSSSRPTVLTQYPRAQKLRPNNVPFVFNSSRWIRVALLPFRYPIVMATLYLGGTLSSMWMWSGIALPANRQRIANMFPPAHRSVFVISDRRSIASIGGGGDSCWRRWGGRRLRLLRWPQPRAGAGG